MKFFISSINSGILTSLLLPHPSSSLTDSLPSLNLLCHSKTDARFVQDGPKAVWSIPYISVTAFFPSFKQNFIAYRSSKVPSRPDCIFEIHQQWQSGFSKVYFNWCCSCWFEPEIIKIGQSSHMYSNKILNFQEPTKILNACAKKSGNLLKTPRIPISIRERQRDRERRKERGRERESYSMKCVKNIMYDNVSTRNISEVIYYIVSISETKNFFFYF